MASQAFVAVLSDIDTFSNEEESLEEEQAVKNKRKTKDFTGLCFIADNNDNDPGHDPSEVLPSYDQLYAQVDTLNDALISHDRLVKKIVRELKEFKSKYEFVSTEVALLRPKDEECESCMVVMTELVELQTLHA